MINEVKKITEGVLGLALWREDWNTYINCYVILDEKGYTLMDTGDKENREGLVKLLQQHEIDYLCTGHGVVLEGDIPLFLNNVADELLGSL